MGKILHSTAILELGPDFYDPVQAARFPQTILRYRNQQAAATLGLEGLDDAAWIQYFGKFEALPENLPEPLALRYHGHQFTHYNPDLGDGRGFLFAQFLTNGRLIDLGTKGSGQTPYSRAGDGRLTLKGAFREALATELLESLGVNTSKTFSIIETGEHLERHDEPSPTRGAVMVRMSHGHIRIGTFQRLAYFDQTENIKKLTDYCLKYYYPDIHADDAEERATLFLQAVVHRCAKLATQWMFAGFVHGVLNSDNINISGESFDYGPYRFLPTYDVKFTAAYFDHGGLYCFGRQPISMMWNLEQLAQSLLKAFPNLPSEEILQEFAEQFNENVRRLMLQRLNLESRGEEKDAKLLSSYFGFLESTPALYEQTFFDFFGGYNATRLMQSPQSALYSGEAFHELKEALQDCTIADETKQSHPYFKKSKPCSLLIEELETLWKPIADSDDWSLFNNKLAEIRAFRGIYTG